MIWIKGLGRFDFRGSRRGILAVFRVSKFEVVVLFCGEEFVFSIVLVVSFCFGVWDGFGEFFFLYF